MAEVTLPCVTRYLQVVTVYFSASGQDFSNPQRQDYMACGGGEHAEALGLAGDLGGGGAPEALAGGLAFEFL